MTAHSVKRGDWVFTVGTVWPDLQRAVEGRDVLRADNPDTRFRVTYIFGGWSIQRFVPRIVR